MAYPESMRDALPRTECWPTTRHDLEAALSEAGVESLDLVYFLRAGITDWKRGQGQLISVDFSARTRDRDERIELRIHAVPSERKREVGARVVPILPHVAEWIRRAELGEIPWRSTDHAFVARWRDGTLVIDER